jgi:DNA-binding transcriptional LysR family regulator
MELRQLKHLLAVLEHGSLSRAADALGISHQGLSKSIAGLEETLNVKLLVRGPRGVTASVYGEVLAEHARFIDGEAALAALAIASLRGGTTGHFTIGAGISAACGLVPRAAARLFRRRPSTTLTVLTGHYADFRHGIVEGEIALFVGTVIEEAVDPVVSVEPLFTDHDYIVARASHPLMGRPSVSLDELSAFPWIFSVGTLEFRRGLIKLFETHGLPPPRSMIESDSLEVTKASLLHTDFLTLLPRQSIASEETNGQLGLVAFDSPLWSRPVALCARKRGGRSTLAEAFAEELRTVAREFQRASV